MAWYDQIYKCKNQMYSGTSPIGDAVLNSIFKPQRRDEEKMKKRIM